MIGSDSLVPGIKRIGNVWALANAVGTGIVAATAVAPAYPRNSRLLVIRPPRIPLIVLCNLEFCYVRFVLEPGQIGAPGIMGLTIAISLLGLFRIPAIIHRNLFRPYFFLRKRAYGTMIMSGFIHADVGHLLFNMFTFYFFAFPMERHIGTIPFLALYFLGLVASHTCTYLKQHNNPEYASLGASGAISAVLFAYIVYFPASTLMIIPIPVPIPAVLFAAGYVWYSYWAASRSRDHINHDAHLCGAISGLVFVAVFEPGAFRQLWSTLL